MNNYIFLLSNYVYNINFEVLSVFFKFEVLISYISIYIYYLKKIEGVMASMSIHICFVPPLVCSLGVDTNINLKPVL